MSSSIQSSKLVFIERCRQKLGSISFDIGTFEFCDFELTGLFQWDLTVPGFALKSVFSFLGKCKYWKLLHMDATIAQCSSSIV